jgi:hypothetical protein
MEYTHYDIPANFTDNGKLLGTFEIRNAVEAVIFALPLLIQRFECLMVSAVEIIRAEIAPRRLARFGVYGENLSLVNEVSRRMQLFAARNGESALEQLKLPHFVPALERVKVVHVRFTPSKSGNPP